MDQLELDWEERRRSTITERFDAFDAANPQVMLRLATMARALKERGIRRYGIQALFEVLRYQSALRTSDPNSAFKLNNDYAAPYAREIMRRFPDLDGFFSVRRSQTDADLGPSSS